MVFIWPQGRPQRQEVLRSYEWLASFPVAVYKLVQCRRAQTVTACKPSSKCVPSRMRLTLTLNTIESSMPLPTLSTIQTAQRTAWNGSVGRTVYGNPVPSSCLYSCAGLCPRWAPLRQHGAAARASVLLAGEEVVQERAHACRRCSLSVFSQKAWCVEQALQYMQWGLAFAWVLVCGAGAAVHAVGACVHSELSQA